MLALGPKLTLGEALIIAPGLGVALREAFGTLLLRGDRLTLGEALALGSSTWRGSWHRTQGAANTWGQTDSRMTTHAPVSA